MAPIPGEVQAVAAETVASTVETVAGVPEGTPEAQTALAGVAQDGEQRVELRTALDAVEADNEAEQALLGGLTTAKTELEAKMAAVEATADSNDNNVLEKKAIKDGMTKGKSKLEGLDKDIRSKLTDAKKFRDNKKYDDARTAVEEGQGLLLTALTEVMSPKGGEDDLDQRTRTAIEALRSEADAQNGALGTLFDARYASLDAVASLTPSEPASETASGAPTESAPPVESPSPIVESAPAEVDPLAAIPAEQRVTLDALLARNPIDGPLGELEAALTNFDYATDWFWLSSTHDAQVAAVKTALLEIQAIRAVSNTDMGNVQSKIREGKYAEASAAFEAMVAKVLPILQRVHTALKDVEGMSGIASQTQVLGTVTIQAEVEKIKRALAAIRPTAAPQTPAPAPTSSAPEAASEAPVEDPVEAAKQALRDGISAVTEGYTSRPPKMGKIIAGALQALGAVLTLMEKGGLSDIGSILEEYFDGEETPSFKNPSELLAAVGVKPKEVAVLAKLTMEQLYAFYEWKKDSAKPAPQISTDLMATLEAFHADNVDVYTKVMEEIFEKQGGEAYAKDANKKKHSVFRFFTTKMAKLALGLEVAPEAAAE